MKPNARAWRIHAPAHSLQHVAGIKQYGSGKVRHISAINLVDLPNSLLLVHPDADFECITVLMEHKQDVKCVAWHPTEEVICFSRLASLNPTYT